MATRQVYRSMQGKVVDMGQLIAKNELTPAVGNSKVNARGDELGPGGKIIRTREEIMAEYYRDTKNSLPDSVPNRARTTPVIKNPDTAPAVLTATHTAIPAVSDLSPNELDFNDPEPVPTDITKRKRTGE
jgi:hypothetical protein